jgi:hypothetical protein
LAIKFKGPLWLRSYAYWIYINIYYHCQLQLKWCVVLDTFLYDFCQWVASDRRVSTCALATSNNKTQCHEIIEILFKVELNTDNISTYIHFIRQTKRRKLHKYSLYNNKSSQSNMICFFICYIYQSGTLFLMVNIQPNNTNLFNKTYLTFFKFYFIYNMDRFQI